jgi:rhodanese-related sulfurtransferase
MMNWQNSLRGIKLLPLIIILSLSACSTFDQESATQGTGATENREGLPYPTIRRISVSELQEALSKESAIVVDVRHSEEYQARAIKGAFFVEQLLNDPQLKVRARNKLIVTYCACPSEITSARVALDLEGKGYEHVAALLGGYDAWDDAKLPTEPGQMH